MKSTPVSQNDNGHKSVVLTDSAAGRSVELPVVQGTLGAPTLNIGKLYKETGYFTFDPGFTATASCQSAVTYIDGDEGVLLYRGYPIEQLAKQSSFLEVAYLLLNGELPNAKQFRGLRPRSHPSHDDARGFQELPARLPPRRASDGHALRHDRLAGGLLPR